MDLTLFTDWAGDHSSRYFWARGALWGFVVASLLWSVVFPRLQKFLQKRRIRKRVRAELERESKYKSAKIKRIK